MIGVHVTTCISLYLRESLPAWVSVRSTVPVHPTFVICIRVIAPSFMICLRGFTSACLQLTGTRIWTGSSEGGVWTRRLLHILCQACGKNVLSHCGIASTKPARLVENTIQQNPAWRVLLCLVRLQQLGVLMIDVCFCVMCWFWFWTCDCYNTLKPPEDTSYTHSNPRLWRWFVWVQVRVASSRSFLLIHTIYTRAKIVSRIDCGGFPLWFYSCFDSLYNMLILPC